VNGEDKEREKEMKRFSAALKNPFMISDKPQSYLRHCEARSDAAIQAAVQVQLPETPKQIERPSGLPRACGHRF
jgi:hypothetical protein